MLGITHEISRLSLDTQLPPGRSGVTPGAAAGGETATTWSSCLEEGSPLGDGDRAFSGKSPSFSPFQQGAAWPKAPAWLRCLVFNNPAHPKEVHCCLATAPPRHRGSGGIILSWNWFQNPCGGCGGSRVDRQPMQLHMKNFLQENPRTTRPKREFPSVM